MAQLTLTDEETEALVLLLEGNLADLSYEIADTDRKEFREQLKSRRDLLANILKEIKQASS